MIRTLAKPWLLLSNVKSPFFSRRTTISGGNIYQMKYMKTKLKTNREMRKAQYSRQLVELTESSGGDGVSQVLLYLSLISHHSFYTLWNGSHNDDTRVQQQTCTSWQLWVGVATWMGCQACLGLLTAEVSLACFYKDCIFVFAFMDTRQFTTCQMTARSLYQLAPQKSCCFKVIYLSKKPTLVKKSSKRNQQTGSACQKDLQFSFLKPNPNMILLHHIKTN